MPPQFLSIKKFENFQHYKTRNPPWIKLYRSILNDYEMRRLSVQARLLYISLLIIASETENRIPVDYKFLSERTGIDVQTHDVTALINSGFLLASHASIPMLAPDALCSSLLSSVEESPLSSHDSLHSSLRIVPNEDLNEEVTRNLPRRKTASTSVVRVETAETWEAYARAYESRYGVAPLRNSRTNAQIKQLCARVPLTQAPAVAAYYVQHNDPLYVRGRHPAALLLRDCEGIHTQMASGVRSTTGEARNAEQQDEFAAQVRRVESLLQKGDV